MLQECSIKGPLIKYANLVFVGFIEFFFCSFYLTSIYDHSIHEAFSKIVQNQIKQLRTLENMLNIVTEVMH